MSNTTNTVVFKINGTEHTVVNPEPYMTLNEYIRGQPNLKGTKKNCGQAGCGVCTVVASYPDPGSGKVVNVSLNSCVHPLISCNGQEITTVEGVGTMDNLHPVQERLADNNGSQCGFCTSGMVCTMYGLLQKNSSPTQGQIVEALDGNLCRCTGYRPIVAAFTTFGSDYKNIPEQTQGRCCSDVRETFPDIEELGVLVKEKYNHGKYAKAKSFPKVSKEVAIAGRENNWVTVTTMQALYTALSSAPAVGTRLVVGNTSSGIYPMPVPKLYINIQPVKDLYGIGVNGSALIIGANETITSISDYLEASLAKLPPKFSRMHEFIKRIASFNIRNVGSWAGNLMMSNQNDFASDLYTMFCAANGTITVSDTTGATTQVACTGFRTYDMSKKVVMSVSLPVDGSDIFFIEKVALRSRFAHSYVNMGASVKLDGTTCTSISLVVAGFPGAGVVLTKTQAAIVGKDVTSQSTMFDAMTVMQAELQPLNTNPHDTEYRATVVNNLLYKLFLNMQPSLPANLQSAIAHIKRPVSTGHQTYQNPGDASEKPISYPIPKLMEKEQTCGKAVYSSDEPVLPGTLYAAPVYSTVGLGTITSIDSSDALSLPGVVAFFSSKDLKNPDFKWGGVYQDEPLFASDEITCAGQLIGLVVAETQLTADMGSRLVSVEYDTSKGKPILNIDDAIAQNSFYTGVPGLNFPQKTGDVDKGFSASDHVITGSAYMGSQLHFQMEPMNMYAIPEEGGSLKIIGSFQFQSFIQQLTAGVLQMPQGKITVSTRRIGGAYGSKITRPGGMAAAVAVAASKLNTPVKTDMRIEFQNDMMGKRNQFKTDYKIGFNKDGKINAIQVMIYQQSGAFFDIDNFSINACVDTISNCYMIPNWSINGQLCKTNIPAQTSVRGPGWASGCYLSDVMLENVANYLNMDPLDVKKANLYQPGDLTPYGQPLKYFPLNSMLTQLQSTSNYAQRKQEIDQYNQENTWTKRGIAFVPARFNVNNSHDPFSSLVVGYGDGTLQVSVGGIECGQGLNTKVAQAVAMSLGCDLSDVSIMPVTTSISPNDGGTGGSITSELCVSAVMDACKTINSIIAPFKTKNPSYTWPQLCQAAVAAGLDIRATGRANLDSPSTPDTYQTYGACILESYLDVLTGENQILRCDILMDLGISMNPLLDVGQIEGAFLMGVGLSTSESVVFNDDGTLFSNDTWEYKIPGVMDVPIDSRVTLLANAPNPTGILRSKAVGEPPLLMGCAAIFGIRYAINAARQQFGQKGTFDLTNPATVGNIMQCLVQENVIDSKNFSF